MIPFSKAAPDTLIAFGVVEETTLDSGVTHYGNEGLLLTIY